MIGVGPAALRKRSFRSRRRTIIAHFLEVVTALYVNLVVTSPCFIVI